MVAAVNFSTHNFHPFAPAGVHGITAAAAIIFFAYIGFDAVSTGSEEARNASRDLPLAIIGSLLFACLGQATENQKVHRLTVHVDANDLATMGATLSNMGRHPAGDEMVFDLKSTRAMLAIMFTCGMYDYSGEWAYRVGVPAKSGVAGGVMAVVNRQLGIATYSPRLDQRGNSRRGIEVCIELASRFGLHAFDCLNVGSSFLSTML